VKNIWIFTAVMLYFSGIQSVAHGHPGHGMEQGSMGWLFHILPGSVLLGCFALIIILPPFFRHYSSGLSNHHD